MPGKGFEKLALKDRYVGRDATGLRRRHTSRSPGAMLDFVGVSERYGACLERECPVGEGEVTLMVMAQSQAETERLEIALHYGVPRWSPGWAVPEVPVPETTTHDQAIEYIRALLVAWVERTGKDALVARNLGLRWVREEPKAGFDPDLCLFEPAPQIEGALAVVKLWEQGPPKLAVEVVSPGHPYKDYLDAPDRAAAAGVQELWIYDPMLVGPRATGGPYLLQVWRRTHATRFERLMAGDGPARSELLAAWLHPQRSELPAEARLGISNTPDRSQLWLSKEEQALVESKHARQIAERERQTAERERQLREQAERRIRELERKLNSRE